MWKTLVHHVEYIDEEEEIVEGLGKFESENDAKKLMKDAEEKDGLTYAFGRRKPTTKPERPLPWTGFSSSPRQQQIQSRSLNQAMFHGLHSVLLSKSLCRLLRVKGKNKQHQPQLWPRTIGCLSSTRPLTHGTSDSSSHHPTLMVCSLGSHVRPIRRKTHWSLHDHPFGDV